MRRTNGAAVGESRTKRLILERFDTMAAAEVSGARYPTALDPPPAHPSQFHPESTRADWARRVR